MRSWAIAGLCAAVAFAQTPVKLPRLPIETHSFNDIDMWDQILLAQQVRWIKLDFSLCDKPTCEGGLSTFNHNPGRGNSSDCFVDGASTYCCICMRGDVSTRPTLLSPFNTSYDMLAWLSDPANQALLPKNTSSSSDAAPLVDPRPLMMGFDWGGPSIDFESSPSAPLVRSFLLALGQVIREGGLAIIPYADGGLPGLFQALDAKCEAGQCDAEELQLYALPFLSTGGDSFPTGPGTGRFQIVNQDWRQLQADCGTAPWNDNNTTQRTGSFPFLWYEQASQLEYLTLLDELSACSSYPAVKRSAPTGLAAVSNQLPAMFEVFVSGGIGRGLNAQFSNATVTAAHMVVLPPTGGGSPDRWMLLAASERVSGSTLLFSVPLRDGQAPPYLTTLTPVITVPADPAGAVISSLTAADVGSGGGTATATAIVALTRSDGYVWVFTVDIVSGQWQLMTNGTIAGTAGVGVLSAQPVCSSSSNGSSSSCWLVALTATAAPSIATTVSVAPLPALQPVLATATVQTSLWADQGGSVSLSPVAPAAGQSSAWAGVLVYAAHQDAPPATDADAANYTAQSAIEQLAVSDSHRSQRVRSSLQAELARRQGEENEREHANSSAGTVSGSVSGSGSYRPTPGDNRRSILGGAYISLVVSSSTGALQLSVERYGLSTGAVPPRMGFGTVPQVHTLSLPNASDVVVLVTYTDGMCECGLAINNGDVARCTIPLQDTNPLYTVLQNVQFLLNADYGLLSSFRDAFNAPQQPFSPCHRHIQHSKFESGGSVAANLFWGEVQYPNSTLPSGQQTFGPTLPALQMLAVHDGAVDASILTTIFCGAPLYKGGLVADSWYLPQPELLALL